MKLARVDRPVGIWLLLLPCWWSILLASGGIVGIPTPSWGYLFLFAGGAVLMRSAGCVINDLWDRKLDAAVARTRSRPLPAGEVTPRQALIFAALLLLASFLILLQLNFFSIVLGAASLLLVAVYPLMKRLTWWPQLFLGFTFNWGALLGWAAVTGGLSAAPMLMYLGGVFWTLAYDTIYAHQDREDDALAGIRSTARLLGARSPFFVGLFLAISLLLLAGAKLAAGGGIAGLLLFAPAGLHAVWQLNRWDMDNPQSCLDVFKSNRVFGLLVLLAFSF